MTEQFNPPPPILRSSGGAVNSLDFFPASLKSLGCFYFRCILSSQWKAVTVNLRILHCQLYRHFWRPVVRLCLATSNNLLLILLTIGCPEMHFFHNLVIFWSAKKWRKEFCSALHPLSPVIFATAAAMAFVLLCNFRFNFHCYTQHEVMPTQKSARKWCCN